MFVIAVIIIIYILYERQILVTATTNNVEVLIYV